ncbi:MAG: hypothetical protein FDZ69_04735 [Deltaproteobacteria bacterium]|nr:MAG: hypothetical protein FDZ69_04735 [Deltaproteobacteria bacterium]
MSIRLLFLAIACSFLFIQGCSHHLEVKNLKDYKTTAVAPLSKDLSIGILAPQGQRLINGTTQALRSYAGKVVYPYINDGKTRVDVLARVSIREDHSGSLYNFLINFPGFLVWASAWNGYVYYPYYEVDVELLDAYDNTPIDVFTIPVKLSIRHAEMDRTWTQVTWLETGVIGLLGGLVFIRYDDDVTPLLERRIQAPIGNYLAQNIVRHLAESPRYQAILERISLQKANGGKHLSMTR